MQDSSDSDSSDIMFKPFVHNILNVANMRLGQSNMQHINVQSPISCVELHDNRFVCYVRDRDISNVCPLCLIMRNIDNNKSLIHLSFKGNEVQSHCLGELKLYLTHMFIPQLTLDDTFSIDDINYIILNNASLVHVTLENMVIDSEQLDPNGLTLGYLIEHRELIVFDLSKCFAKDLAAYEIMLNLNPGLTTVYLPIRPILTALPF